MMKMKGIRKTIITPLFFLLLLFLFVSVSYGEETAEMSVVPEKDVVYFNETFVVDIVIDAEQVYVAQCWVSFNSSLLTALSVENGNMFDNFSSIVTIDNQNGLIKNIMGFSLQPVSGGVFARITFKAKDNAGTSSINLLSTYSLIPGYDVVLNNATVEVRNYPINISVTPNYMLIGNETASLDINIDPNGNEIAVMACSIVFNADYIEIVNVDSGGLFPLFNYTMKNNSINIFAFVIDGAVSEKGKLAKIDIKAKQTGISYINITNIEIIGTTGTYLYYTPAIPNATINADLSPPKIDIVSISPSAIVNGIWYIKNPATINASIMDENLATVMLIVMDNETKQFLYGVNFENVTSNNYSATWHYIFDVTNGTKIEKNVTTWYTTNEYGGFFILFGLYNETGGNPNKEGVAIFDASYEFLWLVDIEKNEIVNVTYGVTKFLLQNLYPDEEEPVNVNVTLFTITKDFKIIPNIPSNEEYEIMFRAVDLLNNENVSSVVVYVDNTPPVSSLEIGKPKVDPVELKNSTYGIYTYIFDNGEFTMYTYPSNLSLLYPSDTGFQTISVDGNYYRTDENLYEYISTPLTKTSNNTAYIEYLLPENILVRFEYQLIKNCTKFIIKIKNQDSVAHNVGLKWFYDTQVAENDGAPIYIPGEGIKMHEITYYNPSFEYFSGYDKPVNPTLVSTGWISPSLGATQPDVVMLCYWWRAVDYDWWYETNSSLNFTYDSAVALYWNETPLQAGEIKEITTFYGIGQPIAHANFSIVDIYSDKFNYLANEKANISIDVIAIGSSFNGYLRLIVSSDGIEYLNETKAISINTGEINTTTYQIIIPDIPGEYLNAYAILYNSTNATIDTRYEDNFIYVLSP